MREQIDLLWSYVRGAWRFRWYALGVAWLVAVAGWAVSLKMPNEYEASAQIHVDTESILKPLMRGMVIESNVERRVELMTRTLLSRPNLEEIARETDMDLAADSPAEFERIVTDLQSRLRLSGAGRNNLYRVSYRGRDPKQTRDVVQATVDLLVEEIMGRSRQDNASATRFLDRKIEEYRARMEAAQQRVLEFRREHGATLSEGGDFYSRLQDRRSKLEEARFELNLAESRVAELQRQLEGETPVFGIMQEGDASGPEVATPELDQKIAKLEDELDQLLLKYTEEHPRVSSLQRQLERFRNEREAKRERLAEQRAGQPSQSGSSSLDRNPVHQDIRAALAQAKADVAAAKTRVEQYRQQVADLQQRVDSTPEIEARFRELQRNYEEIKQTHDKLVERRDTAEISAEVERSDDQVDFRVVEPPRVPSEPAAPNRPLLITASLGAAAAGYGALGLLLTLMWPAFYTRSELQSALQMPVLGTIEQVRTPQVRKRGLMELLLYGLAVALLLAAYGAIMGVALGHLDGVLAYRDALAGLMDTARTYIGSVL
ncbi:MAG: XrtA system polysaccharide chain length determinant [Halofilum sp. (in: g-proteobacteria)]